jgi:hypothetical protein
VPEVSLDRTPGGAYASVAIQPRTRPASDRLRTSREAMVARHAVALLFALTALGAALTLVAVPVGAEQDVVARATRTPRPAPSPTPGCIVTATHRADPARLAIGEETTATVHLGGACSVEVFPLHVVLVLETTGKVERRVMDDQVAEAGALVDEILDPAEPYRRVGVAAFGDSARLQCPVTEDGAALERCLNRVKGLADRGRGPARRDVLARGIDDGLALLRRARLGHDTASLREVLVVFTTGPAPDRCPAALRAAANAKSQSVLVESVCMGRDCDAACVRQLASSPRYFFQLEDLSALRVIFRRITEAEVRPNETHRWQLTLSYPLADRVRLVPGSAVPEATVAADGRRLDWRWNYFPKDGVTATVRLVPTEPDRQPLARQAAGTWVDYRNRPGTYQVPDAEVDVVLP